LANAFYFPHVGEKFLDDFIGVGLVHSLAGRGSHVDAGEDFLLSLFAESFQA